MKHEHAGNGQAVGPQEYFLLTSVLLMGLHQPLRNFIAYFIDTQLHVCKTSVTFT